MISGPQNVPFWVLKMAYRSNVTDYTSDHGSRLHVRSMVPDPDGGSITSDHGSRIPTADPAHLIPPSDPAHFAPSITIIVRARAYNDLHQHPGCVKNSIKWGPHLMLVLTAPESGSRGSRFDAGFNTPHFDPQNGVIEMTRQIAHQIMAPRSHRHTARQLQRSGFHIRFIVTDSTSDITHRSSTPDQCSRYHVISAHRS